MKGEPLDKENGVLTPVIKGNGLRDLPIKCPGKTFYSGGFGCRRCHGKVGSSSLTHSSTGAEDVRF
ncbi:MAG: hypothetical protein WD267_12215 [Balneolales bacterium]